MNITFFDNTDVAQTTKDNYVFQVAKINGIIKKTKITNHKRVIKLLNEKVENSGSRRVYLSVIIKYLSLLDNEEVADEYRKVRDNIPIEQKLLTKEQLDLDYRKLIMDFIKDIKDNDYKTTREQFIMSFYLLMSPRRKQDFLLMKYTETSKNISQDFNYLVGKRQGKYRYSLVFNKHKTSKKIVKRFVTVRRHL